ncbi:MAG TPA: threonine dehydratase [Rhizobacter sp.]|nr:threonine dehydratase [Rhizobacter sp.]
MFTADALARALATVHAVQAPTPQYCWPLLSQRLGAQAWVKHENHTQVGAFKLRGGLVYLEALRQREPHCAGVVSATRGNHGQSIGFAARRHGLAATIVVPRGNSVEKNAAMRALGVELIEQGDDFQAAREHAGQLAERHGLHMVPSFHDDLVRGVATYWLEFFAAVQPDVVFVPIGQGSGICACAAARAHLGLRTRIIGVVSAHATAYQQSFQAGRVIEAPVSTQLADGMACRVPDAQALEIMRREVDEVIAVTDGEVAAAMRALFTDTHNVAEGAGAASLAGALQQRTRWLGRHVGIALTGGNVDSEVFARVLRAA